MIDKLWESGYIAAEPEDSLMGYQITMVWHEGEKELHETFSGTDVNDVLQRAMKFIITHYKTQ